MRFNIIHLSLGLASVVYAVPVRQRVTVNTRPVTPNEEPITPVWDLFGGSPIELEYHYIPPSTKEHEQDNKYAEYTHDVVNRILDRQSKRDKDFPFTGDPRQFSFRLTTRIQVFGVTCPCTLDVVVEPQQGGAGAQAKTTIRENKNGCKDYFINGVPRLPDGLDPHAKPPSRPASPASNSPHCPASPHSPGPPPSPGSIHSSDSWYTTDSDSPPSPGPPQSPGSPKAPGSPHPDSHSDSATSALPQSPGSPKAPGSPHPDSHSDSATSALPQSPGAPHPHSESESATPASARSGTYRVINKVDSVTLSDNARFHNGNVIRIGNARFPNGNPFY
ncbi:hypothetical protein F5051DRAFT_441696 [Lentinula edodes]|nr:hypothetical protein F5051DRAFT_441696 [Lentinula edodes]